MENDLICNFKKCRKRLNTFAWVTSCSHLFCDEDGSREFNKSYSCPACQTSLSGKFDIIRIDLQPSEQYKSMVLAGQNPEVILEICSRAISFWTYQAHQEKMYQEHVATKAKERYSQLEQYYEQIVSRTTTELNSLKSQLSNSKKEVEATKKTLTECSEKLVEKNRQYQKMQGLYDALRRRYLAPSMFENEVNKPLTSRIPPVFDMPATLGRKPGLGRLYDTSPVIDRQCPFSPAQRDFVVRPNSTPVHSASTSDLTLESVQNRFNLEIGTPKGRPKS